MIVLAPINIDVQDTLNQKIAMMKKGEAGYVYKNLDTGKWNTGGLDSFNQPITMTETLEATGMPGVPNYMFARSPWLRVTSFTPIGTNQPLILMGGELNSFGEMAGDFTFPDEFDAGTEYDFDIGRGAKYYQQDKKYNMPYRPMPGVKDISVEYKGGGMKLGATRGGQINWTCWTWEELERLTPHFLAPRRTVLLEWGWSMKGIESGIYDLYDTDSEGNLVFSPGKVNNLSQELPKHILDQKGHYDAMLGLIQNFEWSVNEQGGFDCTTNIIAPGVTLLQTKGKAEDKYKSFASLPLYATTDKEVQSVASMWKETERIAPYLTYREYMSDLGSQIFHISMERCKDLDKAKLKLQWDNKRASLPIISLDWFKFGKRKYLHNVNVLGDYHFVSWGWFEDNVLSRFFGQVNSTVDGDEQVGDQVISEFRSIEHSTDINGKLEYYSTEYDSRKQIHWKYDKDKDGELENYIPKEGDPILQSTRFTNSPYLMTLDTSKWLIPNHDDIVFGHEDFRWRPYVSNRILRDIYSPPKAADYMEVRNIFFNVGYLSRMSKKANDLTSVVTSIWGDFARSYGDVFKFKIEYDDVNKRMFLREEGYTHHKVNTLLENRKKGLASESTEIFEFPIMEAGSIVKTNTINAKLPDRMQVAAMYGVRTTKDEEEGNTKDYDELVGNAWGVLSEDLKDDPEPTEEEKKLKRRKDMMTGAIDYPSRQNRGFGRMDANLNKSLVVEKIVVQKGKQSPGKGTQIRPSIINNVNETQKEYMAQLAKVSQDDTKTDIKKDDLDALYIAAEEFRALSVGDRTTFINKGLDWYQAVNLSTIKMGSDEGEEGAYSEAVNNYRKLNKDDVNLLAEEKYMKALKRIPPENNSGNIQLKPLFITELIKLLRGDAEGVLAKISPLIPVDFEMEIDGTGGMFPGNSFHSSYLGTRYREESLFQMVGVNHSIDSNGWTTTIKGQIRAKSIPMAPSKKAAQAALVALKARQKAAQAALVALKARQKAAQAALDASKARQQAAIDKNKADAAILDENIKKDAMQKYYDANKAQVILDEEEAEKIANILYKELITDTWTTTSEVNKALLSMSELSKQGQDAVNAAFKKLSPDTDLVAAIKSELWKGGWETTYVQYATLENVALNVGPPTGE
jgi:hypothetical protein